jgi:hypothetical protein
MQPFDNGLRYKYAQEIRNLIISVHSEQTIGCEANVCSENLSALSKIWGFHPGNYEEFHFLGCDAVLFM